MKTNNLIDINRLNYLIQKGQASYSDGRESFEYELLVDLMRRLNVKIYSAYHRTPLRGNPYRKAKPWDTTHVWQIQIKSTFKWLEDDIEEGEEEPYDAGIHIYATECTAKEVLKRFRNIGRRANNPHETWSIKLVRKVQPKLP